MDSALTVAPRPQTKNKKLSSNYYRGLALLDPLFGDTKWLTLWGFMGVTFGALGLLLKAEHRPSNLVVYMHSAFISWSVGILLCIGGVALVCTVLSLVIVPLSKIARGKKKIFRIEPAVIETWLVQLDNYKLLDNKRKATRWLTGNYADTLIRVNTEWLQNKGKSHNVGAVCATMADLVRKYIG